MHKIHAKPISRTAVIFVAALIACAVLFFIPAMFYGGGNAVSADIVDLDDGGGSFDIADDDGFDFDEPETFGGDASDGFASAGETTSAGDGSLTVEGGLFNSGLLSGDLFSGLDIGEGSYLDPEPETDYDEVGLGTISLIPNPDADDVNTGVAVEPDETADPDDEDDESGSMSGLMSDSDNFDLGFWMEGFDPDAEFGGLGFEVETGPGVVSVVVMDIDGDFINGVIITEDGFRTDKTTYGDVPYIIDQIPYGACVYGVYLTYSFDIETVHIIKYVVGSDGQSTAVPVAVHDVENLPPVNITDETYSWELTFILRQSMRIDVNYFMVSPNDRFYYLRYDEKLIVSEDGPDGKDAVVGFYHINTFKDAPVRIAVYIEMPAIREIRRIRLVGGGYGDAGYGDAGYGDAGNGGTVESSGTLPIIWTIEGEYGDFSMPDWTFTKRAWQLISGDSAISPDNVTFIRFFILSLPSAFEDAEFIFDGIALTMEDGSEFAFDNPNLSDLKIWLVEAPRLM